LPPFDAIVHATEMVVVVPLVVAAGVPVVPGTVVRAADTDGLTTPFPKSLEAIVENDQVPALPTVIVAVVPDVLAVYPPVEELVK
jgi:hypothetical protein